MPRTATEPFCNLTLTRDDWTAFASALHRTNNATCIQAAHAINRSLISTSDAAMSIDRELEKWKLVVGAAMKAANRSEMGAMARIIPQLSAVEHTTTF